MKEQLFLFFLFSLILFSCKKSDDKKIELLSKYDKVRLISYNKHRNVYGTKYELKIENDTINIPNVKFIDNVVLDNNFSKKIINVLLLKERECIKADCYNPRHIILFYKQNKLIDFYEFCAECGGSMQSKNINFPELCSEKGDKLIRNEIEK
jgi:hypothetical protein